MRYLLPLLIVMGWSLSAHAQSTIITFTLKNGAIVSNQSNLNTRLDTLPLVLRFDTAIAAFKNKTISLYPYSPGSPSTPLVQGQFGSDFDPANGLPYYEFDFKSDSTFQPDIAGNNPTLNTGAFYFKLDNGDSSGPIHIVQYTNSYKPGLLFYDAMKLEQLETGPQNDS